MLVGFHPVLAFCRSAYKHHLLLMVSHWKQTELSGVSCHVSCPQWCVMSGLLCHVSCLQCIKQGCTVCHVTRHARNAPRAMHQVSCPPCITSIVGFKLRLNPYRQYHRRDCNIHTRAGRSLTGPVALWDSQRAPRGAAGVARPSE